MLQTVQNIVQETHACRYHQAAERLSQVLGTGVGATIVKDLVLPFEGDVLPTGAFWFLATARGVVGDGTHGFTIALQSGITGYPLGVFPALSLTGSDKLCAFGKVEDCVDGMKMALENTHTESVGLTIDVQYGWGP